VPHLPAGASRLELAALAGALTQRSDKLLKRLE